ncbi:DUF1104 domain-containing protein [Helicobacter aurati]|uniref:DUF1104 domain-containing protein n=1 Tax=Helicobacter aurati TaxID=137778 RepID=A0A3D8JA68_9HELI|nr:DUF1104 domain-containing protein [Helicobacter aurati]RDU73801.1 DUF1104 domain-containing protein [Helicobacter aurati]
MTRKQQIIQILFAGLLYTLFMTNSYGIDFSKKNNQELIKEAGTMIGNDAVEFALEIKKRANAMQEKARKDFIEKLERSYKENTKNMKLDDLKRYEKEILQGIKTKVGTMSDKAKQQYGITKEWLENFYETLRE